jgi:hypothetical protein
VVTIPVQRMIKGIKNRESIIMVLITIVVLAFLVVLCDLKCALTLLLNVLEKSELISLENWGLSVLVLIVFAIN